MILADENVDRLIIEALIAKDFSVYSVKEKMPGASDARIVNFAKDPPRVILTNDKDFGNWVFAHNVREISVVFLRYQFSDRVQMVNIVANFFQEYRDSLIGKFTTITVKKIRTTTLR